MQHFSPSLLRKHRSEAGFNRDRFAFAIGRTVQSVANYETGRQSPPAELLGRIADVLDLEVSDLYEHREAAA